MIRYGSGQADSDKLSQTQRIGTPPSYTALGIDTFEITDQLHPKVNSRRQPWPTHRFRIETPARILSKIVKAVFAKNLVHAVVKHVTRRPRQFFRGQPHRLLPMPLSSSDRHISSSGIYHLDASDTLGLLTVMKLTFTTGC
jgi:hypothetical protein